MKHIDLDPTINRAPLCGGGDFGTMIFLYLMVCSIQKKCLQHSVGALKSYGPLKYVTTSKMPFSVYLTHKHPCIK